MSVEDWTGSALLWEEELTGLKDRLGPVFGRRELRETGCAFLDGLLSGVSRKTGWMLSEQAGLERPWRIQGLLGRSRWDADALRDEVQSYALEALGDLDGVLIVDETGFLKKGTHSVGVKRQYSGTAGRTENCQIGVFLAYASRWGHALIDRRLYLPQDWAGDDARREKAAVPEEIAFATKPVMAREMIGAAFPDHGIVVSDSRLKGTRQSVEESVVTHDLNRLVAVHRPQHRFDRSSVVMRDELMSEADTEHRSCGQLEDLLVDADRCQLLEFEHVDIATGEDDARIGLQSRRRQL